jgi:hypothetical protein
VCRLPLPLLLLPLPLCSLQCCCCVGSQALLLYLEQCEVGLHGAGSVLCLEAGKVWLHVVLSKHHAQQVAIGEVLPYR